MENFIIQMMDSYGYIGIGLLIFIENLFPPIPSEVILTFGGFMTANSKNHNSWRYPLLYRRFCDWSRGSVLYR